MTTTLRLGQMIPDGKIVVSENGIKTRGDVEALLKAGVGLYWLARPDEKPGYFRKLHELLGLSCRTANHEHRG